MYQQYGMVAGIPNAGQVNALEVLNIRGERSVTCKGKFDAPPGTPLPAGAPALARSFGSNRTRSKPRPRSMRSTAATLISTRCPCTARPMANKGIYDTKDMRTTGGADVNYAMDAPPKDSTLVARLRDAGAIIYAQAHESEYNAGSGDPGGSGEGGASLHRPGRFA